MSENETKPASFHPVRWVIRCFTAGLIAVLPLVVTVAIVIWVADFIEQFLGPGTAIGGALNGLGLTVQRDSWLPAYVVGWIVVLGGVMAIGVAVTYGARNFLRNLFDGIARRIPVIGTIYGTSRQLVEMFDRGDSDAMKGMAPVFCYFGPDRRTCLLGLLASPKAYQVGDRSYQIVMIPTAPVPFGGALIFVPVEDVQPAPMSIDALMQVYISMGVSGMGEPASKS